jgi:hypothetical protein
MLDPDGRLNYLFSHTVLILVTSFNQMPLVVKLPN